MIYKIVGIQFKKGEFTDRSSGELRAYDNIVFNCTHKPLNDYCEGSMVAEIKIKRSFIELSSSDLVNKIGSECEFEITPMGKNFVYTGVKFLD